MNFKPLTQEEFNELNRVLIPNAVARAGWVIDAEGLRRACGELELKYPLSIRLMKGKYRHGTHYARSNGHRITLNQDEHQDEANHTLWHELGHAAQSERWAESKGKKITEFYREAYLPWGASGASYKKNPYEVNANEFADKWSKRWNLIVQVRP